MSSEANDLSDNEEALLQPTISELESRIRCLELRNRQLEVRNVTLTKTVGLLSNMDIDPQTKISKVNKYVQIILYRNQDRISTITHMQTRNEDNKEIYDIVDHWSRCLSVEDFLHSDSTVNNGFKMRPVFSPEDFVTLFNNVTGQTDQKCLQKLARQFASTLSPGLCNKFTYLRGDTRHTDVLNAYLSAILTLQLFALHHKEYSCFFYKTSHVAWAKYGSDDIYKEMVLEPNGFDLVNAPEEAVGPGPGPAIDLQSQRKRFRPV